MTKSSAFTAPHVDHKWDSDEHTAVECDSWDSDEETVDGDYDDQDGEKYLDDDGTDSSIAALTTLKAEYEAEIEELAKEIREIRAANPNPVYNCTVLNCLDEDETWRNREITRLKSLIPDTQLQWRKLQYEGAQAGWDGDVDQFKLLRGDPVSNFLLSVSSYNRGETNISKSDRSRGDTYIRSLFGNLVSEWNKIRSDYEEVRTQLEKAHSTYQELRSVLGMEPKVPTIPTIGPPLDTLSAVYEKHNEQDIWNWFINIDRMVALRQGASTMLSQIEWENRTMTAELEALSGAQDAEEEREPWCKDARGPMSVRQKQWGLAKLGCQGNLGGEKFLPDESIVDKFLSEVGITWDNRAGHENPEERTEALFEALRREESALKKEARILKSDLNVELEQRQWLLEELGLTEDDDGRLNNCDEIEAETLSLSTTTLDCIQATLSSAYTKGTAYKEGAPEYIYFEALDSVEGVVTSLPSAIDDIAKKNRLLMDLRDDELQGEYKALEEERKMRRNSLASTADTIMEEMRAKTRADEERARSWWPHWQQ
ncbi:uncharacterized protein MKK02DRAFT_41096 [Dioszegia hungarica]|uniref:Uncharacterized protein n=1 Tax=Dioszegia hungarica TaxID=4972 RepID=A0AA38H2E1_9TREE|nr:uncharacterized protein MKK02DRAFT_41096 [Dioszegia hungarica]KAI9632785.1 hypothetical protein MKK02DRAFT_41096 [Dioszegia hungarica]